jgi:predicted DNA-binding protein (UPF0251 family)
LTIKYIFVILIMSICSIFRRRNMPRPPKCRRVAYLPEITYFKPAGIPLRVLEEVRMSIEEAESLRLKDLEGLEQEQGAGKMNVSRPTFQRVLASARQKIADALINGKAIRIDGGNFEMTWQRFRCRDGHEWELEYPVNKPPELCPTCNSPGVQPVIPAISFYQGRGRGGRWRKADL